ACGAKIGLRRCPPGSLLDSLRYSGVDSSPYTFSRVSSLLVSAVDVVGQLSNTARDASGRGRQHCRGAVVMGPVNGLGIVGDIVVNLPSECFFSLGGWNLVGLAVAIDHQTDAVACNPQLFQIIECSTRITQRGKVEPEYDQNGVGLLESRVLFFAE